MKDLYAQLSEHLQSALKTMQEEGFLPEEIETKNVLVEQPKDATHGDFATNAALVLSKQARKNPREIGEKLAEKLAESPLVQKTDVAGPGFVNLTLKPEAFRDQMENIIAQPKAYGSCAIGEGTKVNVEFVSANPTGPMHIGHGRNAAVGDALASLLQKAGYYVEREYLMNDAGGQMRIITKSTHLRYLELFGQDIEMPEGCYPGEYVIDIAKALKERDGDKWLNETDDEAMFHELRGFCAEQCMAMIRKDLKDAGIEFDVYFSEYDMHQRGEMDSAVKQLRDKGFVYEGTLPPPKGKEIADYKPVELTLFKATDFGEEVDQAIYKPNGEATYFGQDIAYEINKLDRGFNWLINIWGADHAGGVKRLKGAIEAFTGVKDQFEVILIQMVKVLRDGQPVKMSKRAGNFITMADVVREVGADAFRFTILSRKADAQMSFDLAKAVEKNNENPVFYVQYAHARMCSVFRQKDELGIKLDDQTDLTLLTHPTEVELMKTLCNYPMMIERAATALEPHRLSFYAQELAANFHSWYNAEKFLLEDDVKLTSARLKLVEAAKIVLKDVLTLMGVSAPEKM